MSKVPAKLGNTARQEIAKTTGLSVEQIDPFTTMFGGDPYIGRDGRFYKMDMRFGAGGYRTAVPFPEAEEEERMRRRMGLNEKEPCIICRGEIYVPSTAALPTYQDWGVATPDNVLGGPVQFKKHGLHIAATRALNRAMGQAVAGGFSDTDIVYGGGESRKGYTPVTGSYQAWFLQTCQRLKKEVGEDEYYTILHSFGFEKSNDPALCTDLNIMESIVGGLESALDAKNGPPSSSPPLLPLASSAPEHPDPEPPVGEPDHLENFEWWVKTIEKEPDPEVRAGYHLDMLDSLTDHEAMHQKHGNGQMLRDLLNMKVGPMIEEGKGGEVTEAFRKAKMIIDGYVASQAVA